MIFENILNILKTNNIEFDLIEHEATTSCEHSKTLREEKWLTWVWSKNIIFHAKWNFYLVTTIWDKDIKAKRFKQEFWTKDIRFANKDEITSLNIWTIWSIPPFWFENEEIKIFVDNDIFENEYFMFNPWDPTKTIRIKTNDLREVYKKMENEIKLFKIWEEKYDFSEIK